jgi:hypothetical protein
MTRSTRKKMAAMLLKWRRKTMRTRWLVTAMREPMAQTRASSWRESPKEVRICLAMPQTRMLAVVEAAAVAVARAVRLLSDERVEEPVAIRLRVWVYM